ncbi:MAG: alpha-ketoacid dehydrogenase subunit alpha/beta [Terriglobales bacterium]
MATTAKASVREKTEKAEKAEKTYQGLTRKQLIEAYRLMYLSRRLDDREILLKRQQKIYFQISGAGHEALLVAAGLALKPSYDWFYPYYRDRALCLTLGNTPADMLLQAVGAADDPSSGGRQMPSHWGHKKLNIVSQSSPTGTQFLQALGCAEAGRYFSRNPDAARKVDGDYRQFKDVTFHGDEVVYVSSGEGTTNEGEFWEAMNSAANLKLPVLFLIEDNEYAISVPVEVGTAGGNISRLVANFPNFHFEECDGTDPVASYAALSRSVEYIRAGKGPAFVHGHVIRPYSHSLSDDEKLYRPESERQKDAARDPITRMQMFLIRENILDEKDINRLEQDVDEEVQQAADRALAAAPPSKDSITRFVYSEDLDPRTSAFDTLPQTGLDSPTLDWQATYSGTAADKPIAAAAGEKTMADLINACLRDEMRRDPRIVVFGEDVADCSREQYLKQKLVKGKGGVFKLTANLQAEFGLERVFNTPLAEANIVGRAVGMATRGLKPVAEIQFFDYIWPAMMQLRDEMPLLRWRSNGTFSCPAVIRVAIGGYLTGGAVYHSQCGESIFTHTPGIHVVFPSNALDAHGLLRTAIRCDDPVLFLEHKRLYREPFGRAPYPGPEYMIPFGKARTWKAGTDLTMITYGAVVPRALQAAQRMEREHTVSVELIDLRSLNPYDWEAIAASVRKTSRVIVAHEDMLSWGYGAEIAARIAEELFDYLDAPVRRVAAMDTFVAYQPLLEDEILPQADDLFNAMEELAAF